eukprot:CAMPEP_0117650110 /NCGR_PEP_ID=MMETSP0804-20121206/1364_1 /TAXON_ID=1074897 /ORGANISM="Tetraselmis astigmatica, Strain CCMP880" /LENGTH=289 /DNA_ID=CAMNT_0005455959 /DNA_START=209 /DNA_END=1078 /DNA_ORIENTATION=-
MPPQSTMSPEWTNEEVKAMEAAAQRHPPDKHSLMERAVLIAATLKNKTARDVALRLLWTQRRELVKKAKKEAPDRNSKGVRKDRSTSIFAVSNCVTTQPAPASKTAKEGTIDGGPGGTVTQLLDQNFHIIGQIRENMKWFKVNENTELLVRMRDNTINILNNMSQSEGVMSQMPPLPVRMNLELANNFLPKVIGQAPQLQPSPVMVQVGAHITMPGGALHALPQGVSMPLQLSQAVQLPGQGFPHATHQASVAFNISHPVLSNGPASVHVGSSAAGVPAQLPLLHGQPQ